MCAIQIQIVFQWSIGNDKDFLIDKRKKSYFIMCMYGIWMHDDCMGRVSGGGGYVMECEGEKPVFCDTFRSSLSGSAFHYQLSLLSLVESHAGGRRERA